MPQRTERSQEMWGKSGSTILHSPPGSFLGRYHNGCDTSSTCAGLSLVTLGVTSNLPVISGKVSGERCFLTSWASSVILRQRSRVQHCGWRPKGPFLPHWPCPPRSIRVISKHCPPGFCLKGWLGPGLSLPTQVTQGSHWATFCLPIPVYPLHSLPTLPRSPKNETS